jgi:Carboxypeptidase regulatory-like domain
VVLCVFALLTSAAAAGGQTAAHPRLTTLSGTVFKDDGTLADGGRVTIETADGRVPQATAVDAAGHFIFTRLKSGTYNVRAYYKGQWSEWQRNVIVRHLKVTEITLRVVPGTAEKPKK